MNELRRNPMSGRWTIIEHRDKIDYKTLLSRKRKNQKNQIANCPYCEKNVSKLNPEIYETQSGNSQNGGPVWPVQIIPDTDPVLKPRGTMDDRGYGIYDVLNGIGVHEILIEHPEHSTNYPDFSVEHMKHLIEIKQKRILDIKKDVRFRYVLILKTYGGISAVTSEHAHSHILATPITPSMVKSELDFAKEYYAYKERCIYCDMVNMELDKRERIIVEDGNFLAIAPFASRRPFEIWILPEKHETFFEQNPNQTQLAQILITIMSKIYSLLKNPDYIITLHNGPNTTAAFKRGYWKTIHQDYHWHIEIVPRLHSRTSFEIGSGFSINPVAPELAARILREEKLLSR